MLKRLKNALYFPVAAYFGLWARIRLARWKPQVVVVTGSNGKTTTLHIIEARLGPVARYSHHRNSAFGICFDILGLGDASGARWKWLLLALQAPFAVWKPTPKEKIYIAEADCDRPGEGDFLSALLKPDVAVWLNCARTHSAGFEGSVRSGSRANIDEAIAHEYGFFLERASKRVIVNGGDERIVRETHRSHANISAFKEDMLSLYKVAPTGSSFVVRGKSYSFPYLLPRNVFRAIAVAEDLAEYFEIEGDVALSAFAMPPGRSSILSGIKGTTIIDSSYNANVDSIAAVLTMVQPFAPSAWLILGDMTEQGSYEEEEHQKVARLVIELGFAHVVLVGPRMARHVLPILNEANVSARSFIGPLEALDYLRASIQGGEVLVFKGARFLEGIIEHMLSDERDAEKLCRREPVWRTWRMLWGL